MRNRKFSRSNSLFKKVRRTIPLASQTFSKSHLQYIQGQAPLFITRGKGAYVWDVDGNKYLDLVNALLPIVLGYQYPRVDKAIKAQLKKGILFSLASPLEYKLAEKLTQLIPAAEMVRFGKNGSDATAGAVRLARAYTKRDHILACGYHGWQDWYIGLNPRNAGVPEAVKNLVHRFEYNNIKALSQLFKRHKGKVAGVIMEPMSIEEPQGDFLQDVKKLAHKEGALLIFDEIITGFRFALGGAEEYFGVVPDLACFGKSMANGMPISVVVGKAKYMKHMEDIFFSFTFGGECLSLAAALATIQEMEQKRVIKHLWRIGRMLKEGTHELLEKHGLHDFIELKGLPPWHIFAIRSAAGFSNLEIKSFIQQQMLQRGVLWTGSHNMSFSHGEKEVRIVLNAYDKAFGALQDALRFRTLRSRLGGKPIQGNYNVRNL